MDRDTSYSQLKLDEQERKLRQTVKARIQRDYGVTTWSLAPPDALRELLVFLRERANVRGAPS